jgi:hypothetical protein
MLKTPFTGNWIVEKEIKIFELIKAHIELKGKEEGNWFYTFSDSIDLKTKLATVFKKVLLKENIPRKIAIGEVPVVNYDLKFEFPEEANIYKWKFTCLITNKSKVACFIKEIHWINEKDQNKGNAISILAPGEELTMIFLASFVPPIDRLFSENTLILVYSTYDGLQVSEKCRVWGEVSSQILRGAVKTGNELVERRFGLVDPVIFDIE